ncbi:hypothetical protein ES689_07485 [Frigoribacterium sp. ACAM 257]|uniref:hypothetical protein n=1 Tax=Frigoribacterium sp. ACAM 257 TaxID=2508998 RepID=UPI0011BA2301|nr:hypothetical protein [Frigoribacterium sp. ACAM 257]TWX38473.1 hypothetical protein ES689_07485 [Frigoribacterium sp. ACAM 257]
MTSTRWTTTLAVGALALALTGCTSQDAEPTPTPTPTAEATEQASAGITDVQDVPGSGEGFAGALSDLTIATCERGDGGWTVDGTVQNPTDGAASYRLYMSLLTGGSDTRALQQVDVGPVAAGEGADWSMTIPVEEDGLTCVPRVERYAA